MILLVKKIQLFVKTLKKRRRYESQISFKKSKENNRNNVVKKERKDNNKKVEKKRTQCLISSNINLDDVLVENLEKKHKRLSLRIQSRFRDKRQQRRELMRLVKKYVLN